MALYTALSSADAARLAEAHGLGAVTRVTGVIAGSVNSNYVLDAERAVFVRIYEEQGVEGVAYEWALLAHLAKLGVPVPRRVPGTAPGEVTVAGKPTALFELALGEQICQAGVTVQHTRSVGEVLAQAHVAGGSFPTPRSGRFTRDDLVRRLDEIRRASRPELQDAVRRLDAVMAESAPGGLPTGVIHGDLFRDNLLWGEDGRVSVVLDWESASDGVLVFDLAVTLLAWSFGDTLDWTLARAMLAGYESVRPLTSLERASMRYALCAAAARFTITRITDFHFRAADGAQQHKDWRRFDQRLQQVSSADVDSLLG